MKRVKWWATAEGYRRGPPPSLWKAAWAIVGLWLLSLFGCATGSPLPSPSIRDGSEQAASIAWRFYGRTDPVPHIRWMQGDDLNCTDPHSEKPGFRIPTPSGIECREGLTMSPAECLVAWHGELSFSETALAHELLHVALFRRGIVDPEHRHDEWWAAGGLVDQANALIVAAGR